MRATIVAEIGSNWEGSLSKAKKLIRLTKKADADADETVDKIADHWKELKSENE